MIANDIDPSCSMALKFNADLNNVKLDGVESSEANLLEGDGQSLLNTNNTLLVGDMFYDEVLGNKVLQLCHSFKAMDRDNLVLIGDPGRWVLKNNPEFMSSSFCVAKYELASSCKEENSGFSEGFVWKLK